ncbi:MAG: Ldh family oxidoreductase [Chloroflexi bacterium]|nr:Ldh family oxidoreductase [Chloroflexota bacterium]
MKWLKVPEAEAVRVNHDKLSTLITRIFTRFGIAEEDAAVCADVLVLADLRGVDSHGVSNAVKQIYVPALKDGRINPKPKITIPFETATTAVVDGDQGMGMIAGKFGMDLAIKKAHETGVGFVTVRNSKHYGMAGYYAMMALPHDMIGWSMTNSGPGVVPLWGREAMLGTNPIAIAAPTKNEVPFVFDVATSTVAAQKVAIAGILGVPIPEGWAVDPEGNPTTDPLAARESRALLPLGATREQGGHKGYGLAVIVDIFSGLLSGAGYSKELQMRQVGHFFGAFRVDAFRPVDEFKEHMDRMVRALGATPPVKGHDKVYVAGEPDHESELERRQNGIPLHRDVVAYLRDLARELDVVPDL